MHTVKKILWIILKGSFLLLIFLINSAAEAGEENSKRHIDDITVLDPFSPDSVAHHIATGEI